ncbi:MAG: glycosyltransferase family 4 protein [Actinomycetota bacterium]|nr:glycosyltransferase family 4 protein [Actinomycetota bacterium]
MSPVPGGDAGGVERFCRLLAEALEGDGWRVSIVGPTRQPSQWEFRLGGSPLVWSTSAGRAVAQVNSRPDLIVGNGFLGLGAPRAAPRIQVLHGTSVAEILASAPGLPRREVVRRLAGYWSLEAIAAHTGSLVVVSETAADEARRYYRQAPFAVILNGVDTALFAPRDRAAARRRLGLDPERIHALFVGRLDYRKGADLLVPACRAAGFDLVVAGTRGAPGAHHLGVLDPAGLADAYAAADCVLFPTRYEACSYVILEAMASGTPVLTTRVGWMRTFLRGVPEYDTLSVEPAAVDIAAGLRRFRDLDTEPLTRRARDWVVEHNGLERFRADWLSLIDDVIAGRATSGG